MCKGGPEDDARVARAQNSAFSSIIHELRHCVNMHSLLPNHSKLANLGVELLMHSKLANLGVELLIYDCGIGHCNELLQYLRYICVNIHSPWQQCYILQNPLQFLAFGCGWVESDRLKVNLTLWGGATDL